MFVELEELINVVDLCTLYHTIFEKTEGIESVVFQLK